MNTELVERIVPRHQNQVETARAGAQVLMESFARCPRITRGAKADIANRAEAVRNNLCTVRGEWGNEWGTIDLDEI